jgi:hypothetical protein
MNGSYLNLNKFDQVTQSRTWKQVGDPFNFPVTCTNSAYVLKAVYIKYMVIVTLETRLKF